MMLLIINFVTTKLNACANSSIAWLVLIHVEKRNCPTRNTKHLYSTIVHKDYIHDIGPMALKVITKKIQLTHFSFRMHYYV